MSVLVLSSYYSSANENYGHHTHNEFLIPDERHSFHAFGSFSIPVENNDLNFDVLIINCEVISYTSTSDRVKENRAIL